MPCYMQQTFLSSRTSMHKFNYMNFLTFVDFAADDLQGKMRRIVISVLPHYMLIDDIGEYTIQPMIGTQFSLEYGLERRFWAGKGAEMEMNSEM